MRASTLLVIVLLASGCASDEQAACPDPDNPVAAELQCHLVRFLEARGFGDDQIIVDASTLLGAEGRAAVMARPGWSSVATDASDVDAIFELGEPALYTNGQRVVYYDDRVDLVTFVVSDANVAFVGTIELGLDGTVRENGTQSLPH